MNGAGRKILQEIPTTIVFERLELVSRILGHASTQTTRIYYAKPSLEIIKQAMDKSNPELNAAEQLWPSLFRVRPAGWLHNSRRTSGGFYPPVQRAG